MTPDQLKNSILQLAIQGKLIEQRSEEGTAEELYKQIQTEKAELIKQGKIKKDKNESTIIKRGNSYFEKVGTTEKCIDDELPFEIPESWRWARLGSCGVFTRGSGIKRDETVKTGYPCIRYGQLYTTYKTRFSKAVSFVTKDLFDKCHKIHKNDVLMALTGENNFDIALAVVYEGNEELAMGGDMTKFSNHCMNSMYLVYIINSVYGISCKSKLATGNIIVHISNDKLASILIPLPPLAEQHRIVAKIEELLPMVEKYGEAYNKLEVLNKNFPTEIKKSILQYAIQGKLVEQRPEEGTAEELLKQIQAEKAELIKQRKIEKQKYSPIKEDEIPFDIPENWEWVRWGELAYSIQYGYNAPAQSTGDIKMIRISDIQKGKILWETVPFCNITEESIPTYLLRKNDILFARTGGTVGKSYLVKDTPENAIYAGYLIRTRYNDKLLCPEYLKIFMESNLYWIQLRNGTIATAQPNCNGKTLSKMILPLPPLAEQHRIVAKIEELFALVDSLSNKG